MEEGDLQPYDQVTATQVDNYDENERDGELKDTQIDTGKWKRLEQVCQLRWQLCTDGVSSGIYNPSEVSLMGLRSLIRLVDLHQSLDPRGVPYFPVPIAKRLLCGLSRDPSKARDVASLQENREHFLSIICQSLLCNDPTVVEETSQLLSKLLKHNERASSKFYLTGAFFFLGCYTGSNFVSLAKLIHETHLKQHFRSGFAAAANKSELPMKDRSILGNILPEDLLYILVNYSKFILRFSNQKVDLFDILSHHGSFSSIPFHPIYYLSDLLNFLYRL